MVDAKDWSGLTPEEKRDRRFKDWLEPDIKFDSPAAEKAYKARATRLAKAIRLEVPDRVPVNLPAGNFPALYAGGDFRNVMYDYDALYKAWKQFLQDFDTDTFMGPGVVYSGRVFDIVDYKLYKWPGHGLPADAAGYQFVEGEYMMANEYDALIEDPSDFAMRIYLPRVIGALEPFRKLPPLTSLLGRPQSLLPSTGMPDVQAAYQALADAGKEMAKWQQTVFRFGREAQAAGFPGMRGGVAMAPFDTMSDALRGTRGIIMDMYRQPDNVLEAVEKITDFSIKNTISAVNAMGGIMVTFPLHKGDDTFMSDAQFQKFYWPSLRRFILALIEEGIMVSLFAEGKYNKRLELVKDIPRGWVMWHFDQTDMARAKAVLGDITALAGNVPTSLMCTGTPEQVKEHCRKLIEICAPGGGYILTGGATAAEVKAENLHAMMEAAREYGVY